jgi:hypothetical protein
MKNITKYIIVCLFHQAGLLAQEDDIYFNKDIKTYILDIDKSIQTAVDSILNDTDDHNILIVGKGNAASSTFTFGRNIVNPEHTRGIIMHVYKIMNITLGISFKNRVDEFRIGCLKINISGEIFASDSLESISIFGDTLLTINDLNIGSKKSTKLVIRSGSAIVINNFNDLCNSTSLSIDAKSLSVGTGPITIKSKPYFRGTIGIVADSIYFTSGVSESKLFCYLFYLSTRSSIQYILSQLNINPTTYRINYTGTMPQKLETSIFYPGTKSLLLSGNIELLGSFDRLTCIKFIGLSRVILDSSPLFHARNNTLRSLYYIEIPSRMLTFQDISNLSALKEILVSVGQLAAPPPKGVEVRYTTMKYPYR